MELKKNAHFEVKGIPLCFNSYNELLVIEKEKIAGKLKKRTKKKKIRINEKVANVLFVWKIKKHYTL